MTRCTEPERWARAPGVDAAEEEVERYLAHVGLCPFHGAAEEREEARIRGVAALARADLGAVGSEGRAESRRRPAGHLLSIRVDGVERARLDLRSRRRVTLEVEAGVLVAVWQAGRVGAEEERYLTSYLMPAGASEGTSEMALEGGDGITFTAEAMADGRARLTVAYAAAGGLRARRPSAAQGGRRLSAAPARALGWRPVRGVALALCALLAAVLLAVAFFRRTEEPAPVVRQEPPSRTGAGHAPPPPEAAPPDPGTQNLRDVAPATPARTPPPARRAPQGAGRVAPPPRPREQLTVAAVRRIYVSPGEGTSDQQLREALVERLRAGGRFTVVAGEGEADAVLLREQSRSAGVSVQLVTRTGKTLWFMNGLAAAGGAGDVSDLAARIVAALNAAAGAAPPPDADPRR
jgi:hypothetical protein